ncbi:MAG TPA: arsenite methyltransferase [Vicinamibacterales bacterium]|nr:arsenite methyltransferase [Vicinamibacterales bacterium]
MTNILKAVTERYGAIARSGGGCGCGSGGCTGTEDPISANLYSTDDTAVLPPEALAASLGCGNPTALIDLKPGERVLDLGSGGGIDVLLSARRVGPAGKVYGIDATDDMLALARENQRKAGVGNVEFIKGTIEAIPLPDGSVDVIISNCVINLSADKDAALREAFRVLRPGGRFAVSDVVAHTDVSDALRRDMALWVGCISGALRDSEYIDKLRTAGFEGVSLETWREYEFSEGRFSSAFIRAVKPGPRACCGPECCQ